jgi:hypothetical protein
MHPDLGHPSIYIPQYPLYQTASVFISLSFLYLRHCALCILEAKKLYGINCLNFLTFHVSLCDISASFPLLIYSTWKNYIVALAYFLIKQEHNVVDNSSIFSVPEEGCLAASPPARGSPAVPQLPA